MDVTGDGRINIILGAPRADSYAGTDAGRIYVLAGLSARPPHPRPSRVPVRKIGTERRRSNADIDPNIDWHTDTDTDPNARITVPAAADQGGLTCDPDLNSHGTRRNYAPRLARRGRSQLGSRSPSA